MTMHNMQTDTGQWNVTPLMANQPEQQEVCGIGSMAANVLEQGTRRCRQTLYVGPPGRTWVSQLPQQVQSQQEGPLAARSHHPCQPIAFQVFHQAQNAAREEACIIYIIYKS